MKRGSVEMKKLICAKDIEEQSAQGGKIFYIDEYTIITPSAIDIAEAVGVTFVKGKLPEESELLSELEKMDDENLYAVLKALVEKGLLNNNMESYEADNYKNGLKVVRGKSVQMDVFDTGKSEDKVYYQELVSKEEAHMSAGFLTIDHSKFEWELSYEEIDYVIEGTLTVTIDGETFTAYPGDVLFVPSGSKVVWESPDKARIFYTTYPANWPDFI
jgi:ethanolamine utilization protein EutQ